MTDPCGYLEGLIDGSFGFLGEADEYAMVHVEKGQKSGCIVILEGASIRVRFQTTRDEKLNVLIGDLHAPLGWEETVGDARAWHYLTGIAGYIDGDLGFGEKRVKLTRKEAASARATAVTDLSTTLADYLRRIEALFADGRFDELRGDYEEFLRKAGKRTRAAYTQQ